MAEAIAHVPTKELGGYSMHITMIWSRLGGGGLDPQISKGAVISLVTAVSWPLEWREGGRERIRNRLLKRACQGNVCLKLKQSFPAAPSALFIAVHSIV